MIQIILGSILIIFGVLAVVFFKSAGDFVRDFKQATTNAELDAGLFQALLLIFGLLSVVVGVLTLFGVLQF